MRVFQNTTLALLLIPGSLAGAAAAEQPLPDAIAAPGLTVALTAHAQANSAASQPASNPPIENAVQCYAMQRVATIVASIHCK